MRTIVSALLILCSLSAYAGKLITVTVDPSATGFVVTLPSNPTTGYQWVLTQYDKRLFKLMNSHYDAPKTRLLGAGGQMNFNFSLIKAKVYPSMSQMIFTYRRPWEPKSGTPQIVTISFVFSKY